MAKEHPVPNTLEDFSYAKMESSQIISVADSITGAPIIVPHASFLAKCKISAAWA